MVSNVVRNLPTWLSEGLAEYYSTYDHLREGREATIGRPIESHLVQVGEGRLLPLSELIAVDDSSPLYNEGERRSVFYAQSWALTHMLLLGEPSRVKELSVFMAAIQSGAATADAWRQAFGAVDLDRELQQYIRAFAFRIYKFKFDDAIARVNASARPMSRRRYPLFLPDCAFARSESMKPRPSSMQRSRWTVRTPTRTWRKRRLIWRRVTAKRPPPG